MKRKLFYLAISTFIIFMALGCKKKGLGDSCENSKDCGGDGGDTCLTIEGRSVCTKLCSSDAGCPKKFKCLNIKVKYGRSASEVNTRYCVSGKFDETLKKEGTQKYRDDALKKYKKLKSEKGELLSKIQVEKLKSFSTKYKLPVGGSKKFLVGLYYFSSYSSLYTGAMDSKLTSINKRHRGAVAWKFFPIPKEKKSENWAIIFGMEIFEKHGADKYWQFHKKMIKNWSRAYSKNTALKVAGKFGFTKKELKKLVASKKWDKFLEELTELVETIGVEKDPSVCTGSYLFKGYTARQKLNELIEGYFVEIIRNNPPKKSKPSMNPQPETKTKKIKK
jgi:hypothetical protein